MPPPTSIKPRSATGLFADQHRRKNIDTLLGDPLAEIESYIDFAALTAEVDLIAPRSVSLQGVCPSSPTQTGSVPFTVEIDSSTNMLAGSRLASH